MSTGTPYVKDWQTAVGWLEGNIPFQTSDSPLESVARKIEFYARQARVEWRSGAFAPIPAEQGFYKMPAYRGGHSCTIDGCGKYMGGDYGYGKWCFPIGILHYIRDHNFKPAEEFLTDLEKLPDPPADWDPNARQPVYR